MIESLVKKTMKGAILKFAEQESKGANKIAIFIHTKPTEQEPSLLPRYFYTVEGKTKTKNGQIKNLRLNQDILGKKYDMLNKEEHLKLFLSNFFLTKSEEHNIHPSDLYVMVGTSDIEAKELVLGLYNKSELVKKLELDELIPA